MTVMEISRSDLQSQLQSKIKIYRIKGESYDGCNGWSDWLRDKVYTDKSEADYDCSELSRDKYNRYTVIEQLI